MTLLRFFSLVILATQVGLGGYAWAQSRPSDTPPASFKGSQFVDSNGCIFVRISVDGATNWVPRMNRDRKQICGFTPTFAKLPEPKAPPAPPKAVATATPAPKAPAPAPAAQPRQAAAPAATAPAPAPKPITRTVVSRRTAPAPAPAPQQRTTRAPMPTVASLPATRRVAPAPRVAPQQAQPRPVAQAPAPQQQPVRRVVTARPTTCTPTNTYRNMPASNPTGCRPIVRDIPRGTTSYNKTVTVARHVYDDRNDGRPAPKLPQGYRTAWDDDRLNTKRTNGTLAGKAAMDLVWTRTTPRRLVDKSTGSDVTAQHPRLYYPFTDMATQRTYQANPDAYQVQVSTSGTVRLVQNAGRKPVVSARNTAPKKTAAPAPRAVKTRAPAPKPVAKSAPIGKRYIQVGAFSVASNAQNTARRLAALGLPVAKTRTKQLEIIYAGPFTDQASLNAALSKARRNGFRDAFVK